ncbi:hypothetical protein AB7C87_19975 [Natrarchaeobius sp. A-rgal3]|uniref:hypothetical protein n=1 Tax=Natrarchaeobius versutus TaxID=1679078 RepID=UPI00350F9DAA
MDLTRRTMLGATTALAVSTHATAASSGSAEMDDARPYGHGPYGMSAYPAAAPDVPEPSLALEHVVWRSGRIDGQFDVVATVENDGETATEGDVTTAVVDDDGTVVYRKTKSLEVDSGGNATISFEDILSGLSEGEYIFSVSLDGVDDYFESRVKVTDSGYETDDESPDDNVDMEYLVDLRAGGDGRIGGPQLEQAIIDFFADEIGGPTLESVIVAFFED